MCGTALAATDHLTFSRPKAWRCLLLERLPRIRRYQWTPKCVIRTAFYSVFYCNLTLNRLLILAINSSVMDPNTSWNRTGAIDLLLWIDWFTFHDMGGWVGGGVTKTPSLSTTILIELHCFRHAPPPPLCGFCRHYQRFAGNAGEILYSPCRPILLTVTFGRDNPLSASHQSWDYIIILTGDCKICD